MKHRRVLLGERVRLGSSEAHWDLQYPRALGHETNRSDGSGLPGSQSYTGTVTSTDYWVGSEGLRCVCTPSDRTRRGVGGGVPYRSRRNPCPTPKVRGTSYVSPRRTRVGRLGTTTGNSGPEGTTGGRGGTPDTYQCRVRHRGSLFPRRGYPVVGTGTGG